MLLNLMRNIKLQVALKFRRKLLIEYILTVKMIDEGFLIN